MTNKENEFILLENYLDEKEAYKTKILLEKNGINHKYFFSRSNIEKAYLTSNSNPTEIWVEKANFNIAYDIIANEYTKESTEFNINDFSDEELINIVKSPYEWHQSFINKANNILKERNISIKYEEVEANIKEKINLLKQGKSVHPATIFIFWMLTFFSVFFMFLGFFGFIFGFLGIIAGYLYWKSKITAFDKKKYYLFNKGTRIHGKYMFFIGLVLMFGLLCYVFYINS